MRTAVAGGTGLMGRLVVARLSAVGHHPVIIARSQGVDLTTGEGLAECLVGCDAVIDVSNIRTTSRKKSVGFFEAATGNLLKAAEQAGIRHLVALSIVGADRVDFGYYFGKRSQEQLIAAGRVPWTVLRATQFHEFPAGELLVRGGPVIVPRMAVQPVAAEDVAARLVALAEGPPGGFAPPIAGPERLDMADMTRQVLQARGERRFLLPIRLPGKAGKAMATGALRPDPPFTSGKRTFDDYLAQLAETAGRS